VRRARSNTPLQALTTLNEPLFVESARALAMKTIEEGGATEDKRIAFAMRRVLSRNPSPEEKTELLGLLEKEQKHYSDGAHDPWQLLAADPARLADNKPVLPKKVQPAEAAAWTVVSRVLLNLDETITKE
jgi:hypothetical protein